MSDELPPNWALTNIGTLGRYINGRGFGKAEWKKSGLPIIRIQNLNDETAEFNYSDKEHEQKYRVSDGDLLVAWAASLGVYNWNRGPAWLNQHIFRVEVEEHAVTKPFLYYTLRHALEALYKKAHGSGMVHVTKGKFDSHSVNLPPLNEQKRIVSKIDELFSRIHEGERALERVQKLVERYRQSVLKAAVTGELTREWREKQGKSGAPIETGEALLARILTARRDAWEQAELDNMKTKGIKPKDDKWKQKYKEPSSPDTTDLPALPEGWVWASLESLCSAERHALKAGPFGSALKKSDYSKAGYKIYGQEQVISGDWSIGDYHVAEEKYQELESCKIQPLDVLISLVGTVGKVLVLPEECAPGIINPRLIKVSLNRGAYEPGFFKTYFESAFLKSLYRLEVHGATMDVLNLGIVKSLPFPLCGLDEQREIVARADEAFDRIGQVHNWCELEQKRSTALRQSTLRSAFRGQLVPQAPSDEPASVLLEHIAAKLTNTPAKPKRGPKTRTKASK